MYHIDEVVKAFEKKGARHLEVEEQKPGARSLEALLNGEWVIGEGVFSTEPARWKEGPRQRER